MFLSSTSRLKTCALNLKLGTRNSRQLSGARCVPNYARAVGRGADGARPARRERAHVPARQDLVSLQWRQGGHRLGTCPSPAHAREGPPARTADDRVIGRVEQRAAVPHSGVGLSRRIVPGGHRGSRSRRGRGAHRAPEHAARATRPRGLPRGVPRRGVGAALPQRTPRRPEAHAHHAAPLALLQPQSFWHGLLASFYKHLLAEEPGRSDRRDPRGLDGEQERRPDQHDLALQPFRRPVLRAPQRPGFARVPRNSPPIQRSRPRRC